MDPTPDPTPVSAPDPAPSSSPTAPSEFERLVLAAKASGDFAPVFARFVNTFFFASIETADDGPTTSDFRFRLVRSPQDGQPCVVAAESLDRLGRPAGEKAIRERGGRLLLMLQPAVGLLVALGDGGFGMPQGLLAELRQRMSPKAPPSPPVDAPDGL